jgi:hypothetical protein
VSRPVKSHGLIVRVHSSSGGGGNSQVVSHTTANAIRSWTAVAGWPLNAEEAEALAPYVSQRVKAFRALWTIEISTRERTKEPDKDRG